ncbi:MAG: phospholipase D-like domain-containing protein [Simkaniaceae bacterium]|nr:phospholipase D-like domain-containing protein [Simkaniaceae bacterium]
MNRAKTSIELRTYTLSDPAVIAALVGAKKRGLRVSIETDPSSPRLTDLPWTHPKCRGLMHEKIAIFDGHLTLLGSANLSETSLATDHNRVIAVESQELANTLRSETSPFSLKIGKYQINGYRLPNPQAIAPIADLLDHAESSIELSMYTFTEKSLIQKVVDAHNRGIQLKIYLDRNSYPAIKRFSDENVPFLLGKPYPLQHNKFANIDNKIFIIGSANWTNAAFNKNKDYYLIINKIM